MNTAARMAEAALVEWASTTGDRDNRIRRAIVAGITKNRIHTITGISRATIDRILKERAMPTTTTIPGPSGDKELNGWYGFINGGDYPEAQGKALAEALLHEEMNEFNQLLPENWTWFPSTSEIILPVDHEDTEEMDLDDLLVQASEAVVARFKEIEAAALNYARRLI